jgi:hypothetical protein
VDAELVGGEQPSQLYSWISALEFGGEALAEGYRLETASLLLREACAVIEAVDDEGVLYNRIARLSPLRGALAPAQPCGPGGGRDTETP